MMRLMRKKGALVESIIVVIFAGIISFLFLLKSPLHPWQTSTADTDSSVFKTIALIMQNGGIPYRDSFDHKGPLLYFINYIGNLIADYNGVWLIEFIFLTVTLVMLYRIARLVCKRSCSVIAVFAALSILFSYFEGGNLAEEYAMCFISISLFIFLDYFINNRITNIRMLVCSLCLGAVLLIRPNMISLWIVMYISALVKFIRAKNWKGLFHFILWSMLGLLVIVLPFIIWLWINNALKQCWEDYILFNIVYTSIEGGRALFPAKWSAYLSFFNTTIFVISVFSLLLCKKEEEKQISYIYLFYLLLSLFLIAMSGMTYAHYGMILVPAVVYPIARLFSKIESIDLPKVENALSTIVSLYLLCTLIVPNWITLTKDLPQIYEKKDELHLDPIVEAVSSYVKEYTNEDDCISVYGNWDIIYVISNRLHATKYSYITPIGYVQPTIFDDYFRQLKEELPPIVVIQKGYYDNGISNYLTENSYQLIWAQNSDLYSSALVFYRE